MTDEKKPHILVPRGFQNRELLKGEAGNLDDASLAARGECVKCKGTGAVLHRVRLVDPHVVDGKIVKCKPEIDLFRCKCYMGQFWRSFHPLNVRAKFLPKWEKEVRDALEAEKARIIRESGGSYDPHSDTFLRDLEVPLQKNEKKVMSLDDCVRDMLKKKGDFIV